MGLDRDEEYSGDRGLELGLNRDEEYSGDRGLELGLDRYGNMR